MKIWGDIPKVFGVNNRQRNVGKVNNAKAVTGKKDEICISNRAKDFQTVLKALQSVPDIREKKVKEITEKLATGGNNVSPKEISDKIIQNIIKKKI